MQRPVFLDKARDDARALPNELNYTKSSGRLHQGMIFLKRLHLALAGHRRRNALGRRTGRRKRRQVRNLVLDRVLADAAVVGTRVTASGRRVDDERDLAVLDDVETVGTPLADLGDDVRLHPVFSQGP